jgi:hypothetical protein
MTDKIFWINDRRVTSLPMIQMIWRVMTRLEYRICNIKVIIRQVNLKILVFLGESRVDIGTMDNFLGVIHKNLECHVMANMFQNANKVSMAFTRIRWEIRVIKLVVDRLIPLKHKEGTGVIGRTSQHLQRFCTIESLA